MFCIAPLDYWKPVYTLSVQSQNIRLLVGVLYGERWDEITVNWMSAFISHRDCLSHVCRFRCVNPINVVTYKDIRRCLRFENRNNIFYWRTWLGYEIQFHNLNNSDLRIKFCRVIFYSKFSYSSYTKLFVVDFYSNYISRLTKYTFILNT